MLHETVIFDKIFAYIKENPINDAWKEAYWVIWNMIETCGTELRIELVKQYNLGDNLGYMLRQVKNIPNVWKVVLFSIEKVLQTESYFHESWTQHPMYAFESAGGIDCLHELQTGPNTEIYSISNKILVFIEERSKGEVIDMQNENVGNIQF
jgi:hypothetical protein